jgi:hypothetical protein
MYCGYNQRVRQLIDRYMVRVQQPSKTQVTIAIAYGYITEDGAATETQTVTVGNTANPYDADGFAYIEFVPRQHGCLAATFSVSCSSKLSIIDVTALAEKAGSSTIKNRR